MPAKLIGRYTPPPKDRPRIYLDDVALRLALTQDQIDDLTQKAEKKARGRGRHAKGTVTPSVKRTLAMIAKRRKHDDWKIPGDTWAKVANDDAPNQPDARDADYYRLLWDEYKNRT
jgi:hypothetical protein